MAPNINRFYIFIETIGIFPHISRFEARLSNVCARVVKCLTFFMVWIVYFRQFQIDLNNLDDQVLDMDWSDLEIRIPSIHYVFLK